MRAFVRAEFGAEGWEAVVEKLDSADTKLMETATATGWYGLDAWIRIARTIDKVHGAGDLALLVKMGNFEAEHDVNAVLRVLLRLASPAFAVKNIADLWERYHDTGRWTVREQTANRVVMVLDDWLGIDRACCVDLEGYMTKLVEIVGGKDGRVAHPECRALRGARCVWDIRWR